MPPWLEGRSPFGLHHIAGGNVFMQRIFDQNLAELGITADAKHIDSTLNRTLRMLQDMSIELIVAETDRTPDTLFLEIELKNKTGHKLPTGFPSRRIFLEVITISELDDTLFHSGKTNYNGALLHEDVPYENHHRLIDSEDDVQIYEMVMGDVNGDLTTVLERAYSHLKDNRLPPEGFTTAHNSYDTVEIAGNALNDNDFNKDNGIEGTGADKVRVHIPLEGYSSDLEVITKVHYQTVNEKWLSDLFSYSSIEIESWESYYNNASKEPILMAENSITSTSTGIKNYQGQEFLLFPNPSKSRIFVSDPDKLVRRYEIFNLGGKLILSKGTGGYLHHIDLSSLGNGIYLVRLSTARNGTSVHKVVLR
jgi:hypothetical protein